MRHRALRLLATIGVVGLFVVNTAAPSSTWVGLVEDLVSAVGAAALWFGVLRVPPGTRRPWVFVGFGLTCWVVGDLVWDGYAIVGAVRPDVSIADIWYLAGYPCLAVGLYLMARARAGQYVREGLLDGCIFGASATFVVWQFLVIPMAKTTPSWFTSTVWSAYPLGDALLLGAVAWLAFSPGRRSAPTMFLMSALVVLSIHVGDVGVGPPMN